MLRTCETYLFDLVGDEDTEPARIPCRIEITSRRDHPDVDPHNATVDVTTDARLSMVTRSVITERIAQLNGMPIDGPILNLCSTNHAPENIAVWAYHLANDQAESEREASGWNLVVESARVVVADRWTVEYAPTVGDR